MARSISGNRIWLILTAVLIVCGVGAYFVGGAVHQAARDRDATAAAQRHSAVEAQFKGAQSQVDSLKSANQILTANVWAYRAAVALDNRNFGVANDAVAEVVASLGAVDADAANLDSNALETLKREAAAVKISVAADLASQRNQLLRLADDVNALAERSQAGTPQATSVN